MLATPASPSAHQRHPKTFAGMPRPRQLWRLAVGAAIATILCLIQLNWQSSGSVANPSGVNWAAVDLDAAHGGPTVVAKSRVLVTGGGGMIGKRVVARLLASNTRVTVLDTIFFDNELAALRTAFPRADLRVVHGDIRDPAKLTEAMDGVGGVVHLAAVSRVLWCLENDRDCFDVNVRGTQLVIEALGEGWFIQASSREVYGNPDKLPASETTPRKPANIYGESKSRAEDVITDHIKKNSASYQINAIMLRLSNVYGSSADHRERLVPAIMTNALAHRPIQIVGGDQDLDMVFVDDVVNAMSLAINRLEEKHQNGETGSVSAFNVGTPRSTSAMMLIRKILWLTNSSSPLQTLPGDARFPDKYVGVTSKATSELGFTAKVGIDAGLHSLAKAYITETRGYLSAKRDEFACDTPKAYLARDLLALDGCSGTLAANVDGQPFYATYEPARDGNPDFWGWKDDDEPHPWDFEVKKVSGEIVVQLWQTHDDKRIPFEVPGDDVLKRHTSFHAIVQPGTGFVSLTLGSSGMPLQTWKENEVPAQRVLKAGEAKPVAPFAFRLTPFCCAHKPAPWPFYRDDPLASGILDARAEKVRSFNASQMTTLCSRLSAADQVAENRIEKLNAMPQPVVLDQAQLPTGRPADWRVRKLDTCTNLCDHPTICVDTGDCACGQATCSPIQRFPFAAQANLPGLSYPPETFDWDDVTAKDPAALVAAVEKSTWLNVLRPSARRYLSRTPAFPATAVARCPNDVEEKKKNDAESFEKLQTEWHGCFSADSVMERGAKLIAKDYSPGSLVFLPYYAYNGGLRFPEIPPWVAHAVEPYPKDFDVSDLMMPFTFDWGRCNTILHNLYRVRDWSSTPDEIVRASAWQPMGDLNSPCYFMDQDVVIPARTCLQDKLRERFGAISHVPPSRARSVLVTFKGSPNGAGSSVRQKLSCDRVRSTEPVNLLGGHALKAFWNELKPGADYLETIADTVFCPLPRGTTGWATRMNDVIYGGCIPVLLGDQTHHPFWDILDWSKISVTVPDYEIENLESILMSYTWAEIQRMQTNLILVRDAFLYPSEGDMFSNTRDRGPFFFAIHSASLLKQTKFPT